MGNFRTSRPSHIAHHSAMLQLSRTIRFCLAPDGSLPADAPADNTFAAWPPMRGLGRYYELTVTCRGHADPVTGYFMNIKRIDHIVRTQALPIIARAAQFTAAPLGHLMHNLVAALNSQLDRTVTTVHLRLTPTLAIALQSHTMDHVLITQQYEFSAAHRLHAPQLTEAENQRTFGKCNNPAGHGHNYRLEITIHAPIDSAGQIPPAEQLDALVRQTVIDKLDHKNLDVDVPQFANQNTSVENIARIVYHMLHDPLYQANLPLDQVRIWETQKTACTYRGPLNSEGRTRNSEI